MKSQNPEKKPHLVFTGGWFNAFKQNDAMASSSACGVLKVTGELPSQGTSLPSNETDHKTETVNNKRECETNPSSIKRYQGPRNAKNEPSGHGTAKFSNGDRFEGTFRKGLFHGDGILRDHTGPRYEGEFRKGLRHGRGKQTYPDRSTYDGDWRNGNRQGYGVYEYSNKDVYAGNWYNDKKHGIGTYTFAENGLRLLAAWNMGILGGSVKITFNDVTFHGTWKEGGLTDGEESVFNVASKYLLRGVMRRGPFDEYLWIPRVIERYNYGKLPLEPLPIPIPMMDLQSDSDSSTDDPTDNLNDE